MTTMVTSPEGRLKIEEIKHDYVSNSFISVFYNTMHNLIIFVIFMS